MPKTKSSLECSAKTTRKFRPEDVDKAIVAVEKAGNLFGIKHLVIAIPIVADDDCQSYVLKLFEERRDAGKFTVSLHHVASMEDDLSLLDAFDVARHFPELQHGQGEAWLQSNFPVHSAYAEIMEIGKQAPLLDEKQLIYSDFIGADFFTDNPWLGGNHHVVIPIDGIHSERFWVETYCKNYNSYFSDCRRTAHVEGFRLMCGTHEVRHSIEDRLENIALDRGLLRWQEAKDDLLITSGIIQSCVQKLRVSLRAAGAVRMVIPTLYMTGLMRDFLMSEGFVEAVSARFLTDTP